MPEKKTTIKDIIKKIQTQLSPLARHTVDNLELTMTIRPPSGLKKGPGSGCNVPAGVQCYQVSCTPGKYDPHSQCTDELTCSSVGCTPPGLACNKVNCKQKLTCGGPVKYVCGEIGFNPSFDCKEFKLNIIKSKQLGDKKIQKTIRAKIKRTRK